MTSSEPSRSHLHLGPLGRVVIPLPSFPVDAVGKRRVLTVMVQTIQVGVVTGCVPPGAFVLHSTVTTRLIIVSVFGGERHSTVRGERVTRCAWWNRDEVIIATYLTYLKLVIHDGGSTKKPETEILKKKMYCLLLAVEFSEIVRDKFDTP